MNIKLTKPYKISPDRLRQYQSHYNMPAERSLIVPIKALGDEVSCDIRWKADNGDSHVLKNKVFDSENLVPVNPLLDLKLYELWKFYYDIKY